jgi:plastocyanin
MTRSRRALALAATALVLPASAVAATKSVAVKDNFFSKKSLTVSKGTNVRWRWAGHAPHDVTVVKGPQKFRSSVKTKGSFSHKFTKKGTYKLVCTIHAPNMKMTVKVR